MGKYSECECGSIGLTARRDNRGMDISPCYPTIVYDDFAELNEEYLSMINRTIKYSLIQSKLSS